MISDLTSLRWRKNIYYTSDNVIFDICNRKKSPDLDECGTYIIDVVNAPDFVKNAPDGAAMDIRSCPEIFNQRIPFIQMRFRNPETGEDVDKFYPLQDFIEKGDKIIDNVVTQRHPDVYNDGDQTQNNGYANKFNMMVLNYIKSLVVSRLPFDLKNIDVVMSKLPNWLTALFDDALFMTNDYIERYFARGYKYDRNIALRNPSETNPILQFQDVRIGTGLVENNGWYVPINIWQKEVVYELLKAIYSEKLINQYDVEVHKVSVSKYLTQEAKENLADTIKNCELLPAKSDNIRTFINTKYYHHDCYDIKFETKSTTADTYWEWQKQQEDLPTINVEQTIADDKEYIEQHYNALHGEDGDVIYKFFESCITMHKFIDDETPSNAVAAVSNVFEVITRQDQGFSTLVVIISHSGNDKEVVEINDFWIEDFDLNNYSIPTVFSGAFLHVQSSTYAKPHSRQCVLRCQVGPNKIEPQYVFGNNTYALYVDSYANTITNVNPAFAGYEPTNAAQLLNAELSSHISSHLYSSHTWVNGDYIKYLEMSGVIETSQDQSTQTGGDTGTHNTHPATGDTAGHEIPDSSLEQGSGQITAP